MIIVDKWFTCLSVLWIILGFGGLFTAHWNDALWYILVGILFGLLGVRRK